MFLLDPNAQPQASTWADLSKQERQETGMTKKEYNRRGYGGMIGADPGMMFTQEFRDKDGDGVDDRKQHRPGGSKHPQFGGGSTPMPGMPGPAPTPKPPGMGVKGGVVTFGSEDDVIPLGDPRGAVKLKDSYVKAITKSGKIKGGKRA